MNKFILILCLLCTEARADSQLCLRYADRIDCTNYKDNGKIERSKSDGQYDRLSQERGDYAR
jgi:hypothetical protein